MEGEFPIYATGLRTVDFMHKHGAAAELQLDQDVEPNY